MDEKSILLTELSQASLGATSNTFETGKGGKLEVSLEGSDRSRDLFGVAANAIDEAFHYKKKMIKYTFPMPREWIGPRNFYVWISQLYLYINCETTSIHFICICVNREFSHY